MENWRSVPGYENIQASSYGNIRYYRCNSCEIEILSIHPFENMDKYIQVDLKKYCPSAPTKMPTVHKLVALAFLGEPPRDMIRPVVDHKDMNTRNNRPDNLEWVSHRDNCIRARANKPKSYFARCKVYVPEVDTLYDSIPKAAKALGLRYESVRAKSVESEQVSGYTFQRIKLNQVYKHFKGGLYKTLHIAKDSTSLTDVVVYQNIDSKEIWVRSLKEFLEVLDTAKYPDATQVHRFEIVE